MYQYFRLLVIPTLFFSTGILLAIAVFFVNTNYYDFTEAIIAIYHIQDKATIFRTIYLTTFRYEVLKFILITITLLSPLIGFYIHLNLELIYFTLKQFLFFIQGLYKKTIYSYTSLTQLQKRSFVIFFSLLTITRIFLLIKYPVHIDEAFSYVFLVSKGMPVTLSYYPGPNNHIAYLLLCVLADIFLSAPLLIMRIPVLLISTFFTLFTFLVIKKYQGFNQSLLASCLFSFSEYGLFYAVHGRGYFLLLLFSTIALVSLIKIVSIGSRYYFIIFILASILGFYTIPIFLYPFVSMMFFALIYTVSAKKARKLRWILATIPIIFLGTLFMYSPALLASGIDAFIANRWVSKVDFDIFIKAFPFYLADTPGTFYSLDIYGSWITLLNFIFWLVVAFKPVLFRKEFNHALLLKNAGILICCFYILPPILLFFQQVMPGARVWLYLSFLEYVSIVWALQLLFKKISNSEKISKDFSTNTEIILTKKLSINYQRGFSTTVFSKNPTHAIHLFLIVYACLMFYYVGWISTKKEPIYQQHPQLTQSIINNEAKKVFVNEDLYNVFIRYEAIKKGKIVLVDTNYDEIKDFYDYIVLKKRSEFPERLDKQMYKHFYSDSFVRAYKRIQRY